MSHNSHFILFKMKHHCAGDFNNQLERLFKSNKSETYATKKHQYERDLIQLSFLVHKLRNGH